ncbi:MAG: PKD domain containing protein, partial [Actinomycetes bacterium]
MNVRFVDGAVRRLAVVTVGLVALGSLAATPLVASAADPSTTLASSNPYDFTPRVLDGRVLAVKRIGDVVVVGGSFTQIQNSGANQPILNKPYLFAFDANTGDILQSFNATPNDAVRTIVPAPSGDSVYIGGAFGQVNGVGASRVAQVRLSDGSRTSFRPPGIDNEVYEMRLVSNTLLIGGAFATVAKQPKVGLAALDPTTGALLPYATPNFGGTAWGTGITTVRKLDVTPDGSRLIAIGNFDNVGGTARLQIAMLDLGPAGATLSDWSTDRYNARTSTGSNLCASAFDSYMRDVDFSPDGSFFVVVTTGAYRAGTLCDSSARWETARSGPQQPTWVDYSGGDTSWGVEVAGPIVYIGGHFRWWNNPYFGDKAGPGAVARTGIAALDSRNGLPLSWNPTRERGVGLFDFDVTNTEVWAGSDTDIWAGEYRPRLAGFPLAGGSSLPADRVATLPADVVLLDSAAAGVSQESRYFDGSAVNGTVSAPAADDWSQARGAVMIDGTVYTGWSDGTLRARSYDGTTFGPSRTMDLYANGYSTDSRFFGIDIPRITGMFYDRANARLYYTLKS